jgi:hypothetical protein
MPLIRTELPHKVENQCGDFSRQFRFDLDSEPTPGLIVQRVTRWFGVHELYQVLQKQVPWFGKSMPGPVRNADWWFRPYMSGPQINNYAKTSGSEAYATETEYWEAWYVPAGKTRPSYTGLGMGGGKSAFDDEFSLCGIAPSTKSLKDTSRGKFILHAVANYHPLKLKAGQDKKTALEICVDYGFAVKAAKCASKLPSSRTDQTALLPTSTASSEHTIVVRWDASVPDRRAGGSPGASDYGESVVSSHSGPPTLTDSYW